MKTLKKMVLLAACLCGLACCAPRRVVFVNPAPRARVALRPVIITKAPMVIVWPRLHGGRCRKH